MIAIALSKYGFIILLSALGTSLVFAQNASQNSGWTTDLYPDPRVDFAKCGFDSPGFFCDPDGILNEQERAELKQHVADIESQSKKVVNKSPFCATGAPDGLQYFVILMNKLNANGASVGQAETKMFAYEMKAKYNIMKDMKTCDTTIIIVCIKNDGQLYSVAGRDTKLTGGILEADFNRSRFHFAAGNIASGLAGLVSELSTAYGAAHGSSGSTEAAISTPKPTDIDLIMANQTEVTDSTTTASSEETSSIATSVEEVTTASNPSSETTVETISSTEAASSTSGESTAASVTEEISSTTTTTKTETSEKQGLSILEREEESNGVKDKTPAGKAPTDDVDPEDQKQ